MPARSCCEAQTVEPHNPKRDARLGRKFSGDRRWQQLQARGDAPAKETFLQGGSTCLSRRLLSTPLPPRSALPAIMLVWLRLVCSSAAKLPPQNERRERLRPRAST